MPSIGIWVARALAGIGIFQLGDWFGDEPGEENRSKVFNWVTLVAFGAGIVTTILLFRVVKSVK